jgi:predicted RNA-binding protein YlqC (UPF0109 family)
VKELVEYIAKTLAEHPEAVQVSVAEAANSILIELRVSPDDMGRVIGKDGRVANAMRTLLRLQAAKEGKRVSLEIV